MAQTYQLASAKPSDIVISPDGRMVYSAGKDGVLRVYDTLTGALAHSWQIGSQLGGIDISLDGSFVLVTERQPLSVTFITVPFFSRLVTTGVYKVDTSSGQSTTYSYAATSQESTFYDVSVLQGNKALVTEDYPGSGSVTLKLLDLATGQYSAGPFIQMDSWLSRTADGSKILIGEENISNAPLDIYQSGAGVTTRIESSNSAFNFGVQAISPDGNFIADFLVDGIHIYDSQLHQLANLGTSHPEWKSTNVLGLTFDSSGQNLFVLDTAADSIIQLAVGDWHVVQSVALGFDAGPWTGMVGTTFDDRLRIDPSSHYFTVISGQGLQMVANPLAAPFIGTAGADTIVGTLFSDVIDGATGADTMAGGTGDDVYYVDDVGDIVSESVNEGTDEVRTALASYALGANVENLTGLSAAGQTLTGNSLNNVITGNSGNDVIDVGTGSDQADGGAGEDGISADLSGLPTSGISWNLVANSFSGIAGASFVNFEYFTQLKTGSGDDFIVTTTADRDDHIDAGAGNDTIIVQGGAHDDVAGGAGTDELNVSYATATQSVVTSLTVNAGGGYDGSVTDGSGGHGVTFSRIEKFFIQSGSAADQLTTGDGDDHILSGSGDDEVHAGGGDDWVEGQTGNDILDGGAGRDTISYANGAAVTVSLAIVGPQDTVGAGTDTLTGFENILGSGFADTLTGDDGDNVIDGWSGADHMAGGLGNDIYIVDDAGDVVTENAGEGTDEVRTTLSTFVLPDNVETLTGIGTGFQTLRGNAGNNAIATGAAGGFVDFSAGGTDTGTGNTGVDVFYFGAALDQTDQANGGAGKDIAVLQGDYSGGVTLGDHALDNIETLSILSHTDTRFGGDGASPFSYDITTVEGNVAAGQQLVVNASTLEAGENFTFDGSAEHDGGFFIYGGKGDDHLTGGSGLDVFFFAEDGRFGANDSVNGGAGSDILVLRGNYTIDMGTSAVTNIETVTLMSGSDSRFFATTSNFSYDIKTAESTVAAGATMTFNSGGLHAGETLHFDGHLETDGAFRIFGGADADVIIGGGGNDLILGGLGADTLTGGAGNDTFRYQDVAESTSTAQDQILDFASGDKIDLSRIDAISGGGNDAFTFVAAFDGHAGELTASNGGSGNVWTVSGDVNGDGLADFQLLVTAADSHTITGNDFLL